MELGNDMMFPSGAEVNIIPVMQGEEQIKVDESSLPESLPILALRNAVLSLVWYIPSPSDARSR